MSHAEQVSAGMRRYWANPETKKHRRAAAKHRRRVRFYERQIAAMEQHGEDIFPDRLARMRAELEQLLEH